MTFDDATLPHVLEATAAGVLDALPFGVVGLDEEGLVTAYNRTEAEYAGLRQESVLGRHFFFDVAPCMNNYLVAERLEEDADLDLIIDYVLTFRMRPTPARLRLLRAASGGRRYVLIARL